MGGIAGLNEGTIINSVSSGTVRGSKGVGGIIGVQLKPGTMEGNSSTSALIATQHFGIQAGLICNSDTYSQCGIMK